MKKNYFKASALKTGRLFVAVMLMVFVGCGNVEEEVNTGEEVNDQVVNVENNELNKQKITQKSRQKLKEKLCVENEEFSDIEESNNYNSDNLVFKDKMKFVYSLRFFKEDEEYFLKFDNAEEAPTLQSETVVEEGDVYVNKFTQTVFKGTHKSVHEGQTVIKYDYFFNDCKLGKLTEISGVVDRKDEIRVQLPKSAAGLSFFELIPFPTIPFPLEIGREWTKSVILGEEQRKVYNLTEPNLKFSYNIMGKSQIVHLKYGLLDCYIVECKSINGEKQLSYCNYYFNERLGFVKWDIDHDDYKIRVKMLKLR